MRKWRVMFILVAAQFIAVLDSSVMNVSLTTVAKDVGASIATMQTIITMYALVMAAFMITGGKIGDLVGRKRAFMFGLGIYATGSGLTAVAQNSTMLFIGWSVIEGLGACLMVPAITALVAGNYRGKDRVTAYGLIAATAALAVGIGPVLGGWVTATFSWRWVFVGEVIISVFIIITGTVFLADARREGARPKLDLVGTALSASGLGVMVYGILASRSWGWVVPRGEVPIEPFGLSPVLFLIVAGLLVLAAFARWERRVADRGGEPLVDLRLLGIGRLRGGLLTMSTQMSILSGSFFILPVFLQVLLGFGPLKTGLSMVPASLALLLVSFAGSRLAGRRSPRAIVRVGLVCLAGALGWMFAVVGPDATALTIAPALFLLGTGLGLNMPQLGTNNMGSVEPERGGAVGGLQGSFQQVGSAMGTAVAGSILILGLAVSAANLVEASPALSDQTKDAATSALASGVQVVSTPQLEAALADTDLPTQEQQDLVEINQSATVTGMRVALAGLFLIAVLAQIPARKLSGEPAAAP